MTREDIIRMARQAGLTGVVEAEVIENFEYFAALAAAAEREACAKVCDEEDGDTPDWETDCAWSQAARHCATKIRARGCQK
jgi:hypothetical protein